MTTPGKLVKVQIVLDRDLLKETDQVASATHSNRSAFIRNAIRQRVNRHKKQELIRKEVESYLVQPETRDELREFDEWHAETGWLGE